MPKYSITLCRATHEYADVTVEAEDLDSAEVQAIALADARKVQGWEPVEGAEEPAVVLNAEDLP